MRRALFAVRAMFALAAVTCGPVAIGVVTGAVPAAAAGKKVCTITDQRLNELSGMVAIPTGYAVVNDSADDESRERVFFLDKKCQVKNAVSYSGNGPRDPEDLALSPDGETLWIADTGSNITSSDRRTSVVLWSMPVDASTRPVLHRLAYPGNKTPDAEALIIAPDGTPLIITKSVGKAEIYRPSAPLRKNNTEGVPLTKVGEVTLPKSTTANLLGQTGRVTVTGAARSADGKRVVLRTYADAFEWDVPDGDVVKALTTGTPRATPLADPFGEAITYSHDGASFHTVSDFGDLDTEDEVTILSYVPAKQAAAPVKGAEETRKADKSWTDSLTLDDITYLIAGVGVLGALLVGVGVVGIVQARRRATGKPGMDEERPAAGRQKVAAGQAAAAGPDRGAAYGGQRDQTRGRNDHGPEATGGRHGGGRGRGGIYGAAPAGGSTYGASSGRAGATYGSGGPADGRGASGTTYGSGGPARGGGGGGVYGGGSGGGSVYGTGGRRGGGDRSYPGGSANGHGGDRRRPGRGSYPDPDQDSYR